MKKFSINIILTMLAIPCWAVIFLMDELFSSLFHTGSTPINYALVIVILSIIALTVAIQYGVTFLKNPLKPLQLTIISSYIHGIVAVMYLTSISPKYNGYVQCLVFILGCGYIFPALSWLGTLVFGLVFISFPYALYAFNGYSLEIDDIMFFAVVLTSCMSGAFPNYISQKSRRRLIYQVKTTNHILDQLSKIVYPHQITRIKKGDSLESTMPLQQGEACIISFDIIESSKIQHIKVRDFLRNLFARCHEVMSEGYDGQTLKSKAYRIKEMGDGFLCSVGYPFQSLTHNPANEAVELAEMFARILTEEAEFLHNDTPICCGIGIAIGSLSGFYPEAGTKEYDLYGPGLTLATRYENMRKVLFAAEKRRSILIIQEIVYMSLDSAYREDFELLDIKEKGVVVRDDPSARKIYYKFLDGAGGEQAKKYLKAL